MAGIVPPDPYHAFVLSAGIGAGIQGARGALETIREHPVEHDERRNPLEYSGVFLRAIGWGLSTGAVSALISIPEINDLGFKMLDGATQLYNQAQLALSTLPKPTPDIPPLPTHIPATPNPIDQIEIIRAQTAEAMRHRAAVANWIIGGAFTFLGASYLGLTLSGRRQEAQPPKKL